MTLLHKRHFTAEITEHATRHSMKNSALPAVNLCRLKNKIYPSSKKSRALQTTLKRQIGEEVVISDEKFRKN